MPSAATALSQQLQGISKNIKKHASQYTLLFTGKQQAGDVDMDSIFSLGKNGLAELRLLDDRFSVFEDTLFSEKWKQGDIALETPEEKAKMDKSIDTFLKYLSPYFLYSSSFKVLEWLIRRYRINQFYIEEWMQCMLPYHESSQFVQCVSIIQFPATSKWSFLKQVQTSRVPLDRQILVQRCITDVSLVHVLSERMEWSLKMDQVHKPLWSFYSATIIHYLSMVKQVDTVTLHHVMPTVFKMMSHGKKQADVQSSAMMVMAQVCHRTTLSHDMVTSMITCIMKHVSPSLDYLSLLTLLTLCQTQHIASVDKHIVDRLVRMTELPHMLSMMSQQYRMDPLLSLIMSSLIIYCDKQDVMEMLYKLVTSLVLPSPLIKSLCESLLHRYISRDYPMTDHVSEGMGRLLKHVQLVHSSELSECMEKVFQSMESKKTLKKLYAFMESTFKGTLYQPLSHGSTTLYLGLYHTQEPMRHIAVKTFLGQLEQQEWKDETGVQDILVDRLLDSSCRIVVDVVTCPSLTRFMEPKILMETLNKVIQGILSLAVMDPMQIELVGHVVQLALTTAVAHPDTTATALNMVLGCLWITKEYKVLARKVLNVLSSSSSSSPVLPSPGVVQSTCDLLDTPIKAMPCFIKGYAAEMDANKVPSVIQGMSSACTTTRLVTRWILIESLVTLDDAVRHDVMKALMADASDTLSHQGKRKEPSINVTQPLLDTLLLMSPSSCFIPTALYSLYAICQSIKHPTTESSHSIWLTDSLSHPVREYKTSLVTLFTLLIRHVPTYSECHVIVKFMFDQHLQKDTIQFLAGVIHMEWEQQDAQLVVSSLMLAAAYFENKALNTKKVMDYQLVLPTLLICLSSVHPTVRSSAVACLESLAKCYAVCPAPSKKKKSPSHLFAYDSFYGSSTESVHYLTTDMAAKWVDQLLQHKNEFIADGHYLPLALSTLLNHPTTEFQSAVLVFICSNCIAFHPIYPRKMLLQAVSSVSCSTKIQVLLPLLEYYMKKQDLSLEEVDVLNLLVSCYHVQDISTVFENKQHFRLFMKLIQGSGMGQYSQQVQMHVLKMIRPMWFASLCHEHQSRLFSLMVSLSSHGQADVSSLAKDMLSGLELTASLVTSLLVECSHSVFATESMESGAKRVKSDTVSEYNDKPVYSLSVIFEMMARLHITDKHTLIPVVFDILGAVIESQLTQFPISIEYFKQLVLSALLDLIQHVQEEEVALESSWVRVDHVVHCIRGTDNPQTHNASLLLMASIAALFPEAVLVTMMPVFTFMGSNVVRQDDNYSFHVIQKTLETILPALLEKHRVASSHPHELALAVKPIIKVFVDALFHIPKHRRVRLFCTLVSILGEAEFLDSVLILLLAKAVSQTRNQKEMIHSNVLEFIISVSCQFDVNVQVKTLLSLLKTSAQVPFVYNPDQDMSTLLSPPNEWTGHQGMYFKLACMKTAIKMLTNKVFMDKLVKSQDEAMAVLEEYHVQLVEMILVHLNAAKQFHSEDVQVGGIVEDLVQHTYDALDKIHGLLSLTSFIRVISTLLQHKDGHIVYKCMALVNDKLNVFKTDLSLNVMKEFSLLVPHLVQVIQGHPDVKNKQMGLLCLTTMAQLMAKKFVNVFAGTLDCVTLHLTSDTVGLAASSMTCLTALCRGLGARTVTHMPKFMPALLTSVTKALHDQDYYESNALRILAALSCLSLIIQVLPKFSSPYVAQLVLIVSHGDWKQDQQDVYKRIAEKRIELMASITEHIPSRLLLPCIYKHYPVAIQSPSSLSCLYSMVSQTIQRMTRTDIMEQHVAMFKFFMTGLDYRRVHGSHVTQALVESIEGDAIASFMHLVVKLNESMFRPLFLKLVDWATSQSSTDVTMEDVLGKTSVFYKLVDRLLDTLKSIFTPYCGYILDHAMGLLEDYVKRKEHVTFTVWCHIMGLLHKCCLFDQDGFMTADKFHRLYPVLLKQITVTPDNEQEYLDIMSKYVIPCIGQLAVCVGRDDLWKPLNQKILLKSRDQDPRVRLVCLKIIHDLVVRLGEDVLVLLPETIPFLAELMEDEEETVELECQKVCLLIEQHLGEPIQQYFNA